MTKTDDKSVYLSAPYGRRVPGRVDGIVRPDTCSAHFEVASVKLNTSLRNGIGNKFGPGSTRWTNVPLIALIEQIYRFKNYQIVGGPAWMD